MTNINAYKRDAIERYNDNVIENLNDEIIILKDQLGRIRYDNEQCNDNVREIQSKILMANEENGTLKEQLRNDRVNLYVYFS